MRVRMLGLLRLPREPSGCYHAASCRPRSRRHRRPQPRAQSCSFSTRAWLPPSPRVVPLLSPTCEASCPEGGPLGQRRSSCRLHPFAGWSACREPSTMRECSHQLLYRRFRAAGKPCAAPSALSEARPGTVRLSPVSRRRKRGLGRPLGPGCGALP